MSPLCTQKYKRKFRPKTFRVLTEIVSSNVIHVDKLFKMIFIIIGEKCNYQDDPR